MLIVNWMPNRINLKIEGSNRNTNKRFNRQSDAESDKFIQHLLQTNVPPGYI